MKNKILQDNGDWLLIDISTPSQPNATSKMDTADFVKIPGRISNGGAGYPTLRHHGKRVLVHRFLFPDWEETDHINRDRADNRRSNLRECTHQQNACNKPICSANRSGITGVFWVKRISRWVAQIRCNYKHTHLGCFTDIAEAKAARRAAELEYFGEFAPDNQRKELIDRELRKGNEAP